MDVEKIVFKQIETVKGNKIKDRNGNLKFQEDLGFDSISIIAFLSDLGDELGINIFEFDGEDLRFTTVGELVDIIAKHSAKTHA